MVEFRKHGEMLRDERRGSPAIKRQTDAAKKLFTTHPEVAMSMVEELKRVMGAVMIGNRRSVDRQDLEYSVRVANDFFRDHGQALLDSIKDSRRLDFADATCWGNTYSCDGTRHNSVRDSIDHDLARTKASAGGGA
jgi:hypothetical protein